MTTRATIQCLFHLVVALGLTLTTAVDAATNCGSPGANQVIIWQHEFSGNCDVLNLGNHPYSEIASLSVGNDQISSVSVGSNVRVTLFEHDLDQGASVTLFSSSSVVSNFNDLTSSLRVQARATDCADPGPWQVVVYEHYYYEGYCDTLEVGDYSYDAVSGMAVGNDSISAIKVGSNVHVILYEHIFSGAQQWHYNSIYGLDSFFNDLTSSMTVDYN